MKVWETLPLIDRLYEFLGIDGFSLGLEIKQVDLKDIPPLKKKTYFPKSTSLAFCSHPKNKSALKGIIYFFQVSIFRPILASYSRESQPSLFLLKYSNFKNFFLIIIFHI